MEADDSPLRGDAGGTAGDTSAEFVAEQHAMLRERKMRVVQRERDAEMRQRRATEREWMLKKQELEQVKLFREAAEAAQATAWQDEIERLQTAYDAVQRKIHRLAQRGGGDRLAEVLEQRTTSVIMRQYYGHLARYTQRCCKVRVRSAVAEGMSNRRDAEVRARYYAALLQFVAVMRADDARRRLGVVQCRSVLRMGARRQRDLLARYFSVLGRAATAASAAAVRLRAAKTFACMVTSSVLMRYFAALAAYRTKRAQGRHTNSTQRAALAMTLRAREHQLRSRYFTMLGRRAALALQSRKCIRRQRSRMAASMCRLAHERMLGGYYARLRSFRTLGQQRRVVRRTTSRYAQYLEDASRRALLLTYYQRLVRHRGVREYRRTHAAAGLMRIRALAVQRLRWQTYVCLRDAGRELGLREAAAARRVWQRKMVDDMGQRAMRSIMQRYLFKLLLRIALTGLEDYQEIGGRVENAITVLKQQQPARSASSTTASMSSASSASASLSRSSTSPVWLRPANASFSPSPTAARAHCPSLPPTYPTLNSRVDPTTPLTPLTHITGSKGIMSPSNTPLRSASDLSVSVLSINPNPPSPVVQVLNLSRRIHLPCEHH